MITDLCLDFLLVNLLSFSMNHKKDIGLCGPADAFIFAGKTYLDDGVCPINFSNSNFALLSIGLGNKV